MSKPITTLQDGFYQERAVIKITRTQYGLIVGVNATAKVLKTALARIPDDAVVVDVEDYDAPLPMHRAMSAHIYVFEVEKKEEA